MWSLPSVYIRFAIFFIFVVLIGVMIPLIVLFSILFVIGLVFMLLIVLCFACRVCGKIKFSAALLKMSMQIMHKYPSVFFINMLSLILQNVFFLYIFNRNYNCLCKRLLILDLCLSNHFIFLGVTCNYLCFISHSIWRSSCMVLFK